MKYPMFNSLDAIINNHCEGVIMCGIVGAVAKRDVVQVLLEGIKRLEYRGYDSAGIAVIDSKRDFLLCRTLGKIKKLQSLLELEPLAGNVGIAHTRWATHGKPSEKNAHPHIASDEIAIVHNGIIENHANLRASLLSKGCRISSETDSELVAHLVYRHMNAGLDFLSAVSTTAHELEGSFAIGFMCRSEPEHIIALRRGSPLVLGLGNGENFIASDQSALISIVKRFIYLADGDIADVYHDSVNIYDSSGKKVTREVQVSDLNQELIGKGGYSHYMLKEIFEQPDAISSTLEGRMSHQRVFIEAFGVEAPKIFEQIQRVQIVACGTSFHAALVAKSWFEEIAGIPCQAEIASEFRYRNKVVEPNTLFVTLSQSGETADSMAALRLANKSDYLATLAICNVPESSMVRESDLVLMTRAGPEISVASTKSFTTQMATLFLLMIALGRFHHINSIMETRLIGLLATVPKKISETLALDSMIRNLAKDFVNASSVLFLGRGMQLPIAMEGALKLKEISYIHAEAYPAGELKHGPIALVDNKIPIVALAPADELLEKLKSNIQEVLAREGKIFIVGNAEVGLEKIPGIKELLMPNVDRLLAPIIYAIPMQLLAYHIAILKGTDIDQPRNLAKSVTVE